jgi:MFS family permease
LTSFSCLCTYVSIVCSVALGAATLIERYNFSETDAGLLYTMPYIISAILSPIIGFLSDKFGHRMTTTLAGSFLMIVAHLISLFTVDCDKCAKSIIPLILLGIAYTTYAVVLWGAIPYMVEGRALGTAFGIATTFNNLGTVAAPPFVGYIFTKFGGNQKGYFAVDLFFVIISMLAFAFNFGVYWIDKKKRLNIL